jgi:hypothetical protein
MRALTLSWEKSAAEHRANSGLLISGSKVRVLVRPLIQFNRGEIRPGQGPVSKDRVVVSHAGSRDQSVGTRSQGFEQKWGKLGIII